MTIQTRWFSVAHSRSRRVAAVVLALFAAEACSSWQPARDPLPKIAESQSRTIRVTLGSGQRYQLTSVAIRGDSLYGRTESKPMAVALSDVKATEEVRLDGARTMALVAVLGIAVLAVRLGSKGPKDQQLPKYVDPNAPTYSCPLVYAWDGHEWRLDSGTFGGAIMRSLQRTDVDNLDYATPVEGMLRLRLANELNETDHVDALRALAVDHPANVSVAPDAAGNIHTFGSLVSPLSARDFAGRDALARVRSKDDWKWESVPTGRDSLRPSDIRDGLELTFARPASAQRAHLVLDGNNTSWAAMLLGQYVAAHGTATQAWYDSLNSNPMVAMMTGGRLAREAFLSASVWSGSAWTQQGIFWEAGPEVSKRQVMDLDLSGVAGDTVRVRLESVPSFWFIDRVSMDFGADQPVRVTELPLADARDLKGADVRPLIDAIDNRYYSLETGDAALLSFAVPAPVDGMTRSFLLRSTGWYRVHTPETDAPDAVTLGRITNEPLGLSRVAVERLNAVLRAAGTR